MASDSKIPPQGYIPPPSGEPTVQESSIHKRQSRPVVAEIGARDSSTRTNHFFHRLLAVFKPVVLYLLEKSHTLLARSDRATRVTERVVGVLNGLSEQQASQLAAWVELGGEGQRASRQIAAERIRQCVEQGLYNLDLGGLGLTELPDIIGEISWLKSLSCNNNRLQKLPETLGKLKNLQLLNGEHNRFTVFPELILKLKRLKVLGLGRNQLRTLPMGLGALTRLQQLGLQFNRFKQLPAALAELNQTDMLHQRLVLLYGNAVRAHEVQKWVKSRYVFGMDLRTNNQLAFKEMYHMPLDEKIAYWFDLAGRELPEGLLESFQSEHCKTALNLYISKLLMTGDYRKSPEKARRLALVITDVLKAMAEDPKVMEACLAVAITSCETCGDRVQIGLNEMELAVAAARLKQQGGLRALVDFKTRMVRKQLVEQFADSKYRQLKKQWSRSFPADQVEVRLAYLLGLRQSLALPLRSDQIMLYGRYAQVSKQDIAAAERQLKDQLTRQGSQLYLQELLQWSDYTDVLREEYFGHLEQLNEQLQEEYMRVFEDQGFSEAEIYLKNVLEPQKQAQEQELFTRVTLALIEGKKPPEPYSRKDYMRDIQAGNSPSI